MFNVLEGGKQSVLGSKFSACTDLFARGDYHIGAGETRVIGLGVSLTDEMIVELIGSDSEIALESFMQTHHFKLYLRSSKGKDGLILPNGVGIIDIDYRDEIKIIIHNPMTLELKGVTINDGDKIAQIELVENKTYLLGFATDEVRIGGLGSTGA